MKQKGGSIQSTTVSPLGQWGMPRGQQNKMGVGNPQRKQQKQYRLSGDGGQVVSYENGGLEVHNISTAAGRWGLVAMWVTKMEDSKSTT